MPEQVEGEALEHARAVGVRLLALERGLDGLHPDALTEAGSVPRLAGRAREDERRPRRTDEELLTEKLDLERRQEHAVRAGVISVNFATWMLNRQRMSRTDHALMQVFVERAGTVVSKRELSLACWGSAPQNRYGRMTSRAVDAAVSRLRQKGVPLINIWGVGWLLPE